MINHLETLLVGLMCEPGQVKGYNVHPQYWIHIKDPTIWILIMRLIPILWIPSPIRRDELTSGSIVVDACILVKLMNILHYKIIIVAT